MEKTELDWKDGYSQQAQVSADKGHGAVQ